MISLRSVLTNKSSVADPGCLSRILISIHPGSRIQKQQQKRGVKCIRKNFNQFSKNYITVSQNMGHLSSQKYGFGFWDPEKTYSQSRIQGSKRHQIPDPNPLFFRAKLSHACKFACGIRELNAPPIMLAIYR
jgi:hypothetical protein